MAQLCRRRVVRPWRLAIRYGALADDAGDDNALAASGMEGSEAGEAGAVPAIGVVVTIAVGVFGAGLSGTLLLHAATVAANMIEASISLRMANSFSRWSESAANAPLFAFDDSSLEPQSPPAYAAIRCRRNLTRSTQRLVPCLQPTFVGSGLQGLRQSSAGGARS